MSVETDAEHVEHLPLEPVPPLPQRHGRWQRRVGVVDMCANDDSLARRRIREDVNDAKAIACVGIFEQVDGRQLGQIVEAAVAFEKRQRRNERFGGKVKTNILAETAGLKTVRSEPFSQPLFGCSHWLWFWQRPHVNAAVAPLSPARWLLPAESRGCVAALRATMAPGLPQSAA